MQAILRQLKVENKESAGDHENGEKASEQLHESCGLREKNEINVREKDDFNNKNFSKKNNKLNGPDYNSNAHEIFSKLSTIPPLKVFNLPSTKTLPLKLPKISVQITSCSITMKPITISPAPLLGKRPQPQWLPIQQKKISISEKSEASHSTESNQRKNTIATCDTGLLKRQCGQANDFENCFDILDSATKSLKAINVQKTFEKMNAKKIFLKNNFSENLSNSVSCDFSKICSFSENCENDSCLKHVGLPDGVGDEKTPLKRLLKDLILTSDKMPEESDCRLKLMSLVKKYQTADLQCLFLD